MEQQFNYEVLAKLKRKKRKTRDLLRSFPPDVGNAPPYRQRARDLNLKSGEKDSLLPSFWMIIIALTCIWFRYEVISVKER